jgi:putative hemolysin
MDSDAMWGKLIPIGIAMLLYGAFHGIEVAILAAQKNRLQQMLEAGMPGAAMALLIRESPERHLTTLRLFMTLMGIFAAVLAGWLAVRDVSPWMGARWPFSAGGSWALACALGLVTAALTYIALVAGQIVPRVLAQQHPEHVVRAAAWPLHVLTRCCGAARAIVALSSSVVLRLLGQRGTSEAAPTIPMVTEEDVTSLVREGAERGIFEEVEQELIEGVFEFTDTAAREVMVPRVRMQALEVTTPPEEITRRLVDIGHTRVPVYRGDLDHIVGVLYFKDVLRMVIENQPWTVESLLHPPLYVPETVQISRVLRTLQQRHLNMAIVVDEHGGIAGLITIEDLLEQLVGDLPDEAQPEANAAVARLPDGALVVQGNTPLWDLREQYELPVEEDPDYQTLAGMLLTRLGHIPQGGESITEHGHTFTVVDMHGPRIARIKVEKRASGEAPPTPVPQTPEP